MANFPTFFTVLCPSSKGNNNCSIANQKKNCWTNRQNKESKPIMNSIITAKEFKKKKLNKNK